MKFHAPLFAIASIACLHAADVPKVFEGLLEKDTPVRAQIGVVLPPPEIDKYVAKVQDAAKKDPKWFREFSGQSTPGAPLPFDAKLGLTNEEYNEYLKLWNKREFKPIEDVMVLLRQSAGNTWTLSATGTASTLTTLRYVEKEDIFRSPNGEMKRIKDIQADPASILGEWTGHEWKFEEETGLGKVKENIAVGHFTDKKYGIIVYRAQELSSEGTRLLDKSMVVRFPLGKSAPATKEATPAATPTAKPATKPAAKTSKAAPKN
ncbi:MAG: hypothetical protein ABI162_03775 [Luteolibacter sp.]